MAKVLVIGGGVAGLAAAYWSLQDGHQVELLEATAKLGGRTQTLLVDGHVLESGLDGFAPVPSALRELCLELGIPIEERTPHERFVVQGDKHWRLPQGLDLHSGAGVHLLTKLPLSSGSKWKLGTERFGGGSSASEESLESFLSRRLGEELWRILEPVATAEWGGNSADLVAALAYPAMAALEKQGGLVQGSKKVQPQSQIMVRGGMGNLVRSIGLQLQASGVKLYPRQEALALAKDKMGWKVQTAVKIHEADAVIIAVPAPQAAKIFRRTAPSFTTLLNHFPHSHNAKVWQGFKVESQGHPTGEWSIAVGQGYGAYRICVLPPINGIQTASAEFMGSTAKGNDTALSKQTTADLTKLWGQPVQPVASWAFRYPSSRPLFNAKYAQRISDLEQTLLHAPGLFLTGSYLAGPSLAHAVVHARVTVGRTLDFLLMGTETSSTLANQP